MPVMVTVADLAEQMHMDKHNFYEWARRDDDPLPLRTVKGMRKSSCISVADWLSWWERNTDLFKEVQR